MQNEAIGLRGRSCVISSQLVKQYDQDTSFLKGSKLHIAFMWHFGYVKACLISKEDHKKTMIFLTLHILTGLLKLNI